MTNINHLPPERMTPEQRRQEVASLLAAGIARLHGTSEKPSAESEFELAIPSGRSVHEVSNLRRKSESK
ncbi:MAG: hypothetical protein WCI39_09435 [Gallionellaceae bacterium]